MRELKFRCWDWKRKKLIYSIEKYLEAFFEEYFAGDNFEQYTGLKDKNGKEIYEGDVVEYGNRNMAIVRFEQGGFYPFSEQYNDFGCPYGEDVKIIGNIHENGEILINKGE